MPRYFEKMHENGVEKTAKSRKKTLVFRIKKRRKYAKKRRLYGVFLIEQECFFVSLQQVFGVVEVALHTFENVGKSSAVNEAMVDGDIQNHNVFAVFHTVLIPRDSRTR